MMRCATRQYASNDRRAIHAKKKRAGGEFFLYAESGPRYRCVAMRATNVRSAIDSEAARAFEASADTIMYRWSAERDVWVSPAEITQARAYLERVGVTTAALPDGRFAVHGETAATLGAARLVFLGLRHLHARRRAHQASTPSVPLRQRA
jgi:hypothetical protein